MKVQRELPKKKAPAKGEAGYLDAQKRLRIGKTLLYILIAAAIFLLGLCLNKFEKSNIFTIIAVLLVLPGVKSLVSVIVILPFRSVAAERVEKVNSLKRDADIAYTDMVFTSPDRVMFFSFLVITSNELICLAGREKEDVPYMERYLKEELRKRMLAYKVYITKEEKNFYAKVEHSVHAEEVPEELTGFLRSLMA